MKIESVKQAIKPLNLSATRVVSAEELEYFQFYQIDFETRFDNVQHYFGSLQVESFTIACHYYELESAHSTCFILHGYYDHSGLYKHLINYCLSRGMSVIIYDLPGHGLSSGKSAEIDSFETYQTILKGVISFFQSKIAGDMNIIAQSTGGAVAMDFILSQDSHPFKKLVLLAPLIKPVGWGLSAKFVDVIKVFISSMPRVFTSNSNDKDFVHFLEHEDPLQYRRLSLVWVSALKKWMKYFSALGESSFSPLVIQGDKDLTVDWQYNMPIIKQKFVNAEVVYIKGGFHHLACETKDIRKEIYILMDDYFSVSI